MTGLIDVKAWREFTVTLRMRGTIGDRRTSTRRFKVYANTYEEAITKAQVRALDSIAFTVEVR